MNRVSFWSSALGVALAMAALSALFLPYEWIGLETQADRMRAWLLTLWTAGVMGICFGVAGLLSGIAPIGVRDVAEAGSVAGAVQARREAVRRQGAADFYNFAGWTVAAGAILILIYFAAWLYAGR